MSIKVGQTFESRYDVHDVLGKGGFATVYRATDRTMHRDVAIKVLSHNDVEGSSRARFFREAEILSGLQHPNIVTLFDFGEASDGTLFMVFEFVAGRDLVAVLREEGPLDVAATLHVLDQLLAALTEAHAHNLLHRDIKPANVLIHPYFDDPYRVKLIDFGVVKRMDEARDQRLTATGRIVGTLRYMAPEQLYSDSIDARADIYSLGLLGYELLTAESAIEGRSQKSLISEQLSEQPLVVPRKAGPSEIRRVLDRAMQREADDRWPSAAAMRDALRLAATTPAEAHTATDTGSRRPPPRQPTSHPADERRARNHWPMLAGFVGGVALVFFALSSRVEPPPQPPRVPAPVVPVVTSPPEVPVSVVDAGEDVAADADVELAWVGCGGPAPTSFDGFLDLGWPEGPVAAHVPENYDGSEQLPVVILMHRALRSGPQFLDESNLIPVADEHRFLVLAPTSTSPVGWRPEDPAAVQRLVTNASRMLCVNTKRVYLIGDANSGRTARRITCELPISAYVTTMDGSGGVCRPVAKSARLRIFGLGDLNVPIDGGFGCNALHGEFMSAPRITERWLDYLDCDKTAPATETSYDGGRCVSWDCKDSAFSECSTDGGHNWPGADKGLVTPACRTSEPAVAFPFAEVIWDFFVKYGVDVDIEAVP